MIKQFSIYFLVLFFLMSVLPSSAKPTKTEDQVAHAKKLFEQKKYSEALIEWRKLSEDKDLKFSPELIFNLGLTEVYNQDYGYGIAHLRLAKTLQPYSLKIRNTLNWAEKIIEEKNYYDIKKDPLSAEFFLVLPKLLLIFLALTALLIPTIIALRQSLINISISKFLRPIFWGGILSLIPLALLSWQLNYEAKTYATYLGPEPGKLYTFYDAESPEIGAINVGDSVEILQNPKSAQGGWILISTSETAYGWTPADKFIVHKGKIDPL